MIDILWILKEGSLVNLTNTNKLQQHTWGGRFLPGAKRVDHNRSATIWPLRWICQLVQSIMACLCCGS